jgi:hypothetical protein
MGGKLAIVIFTDSRLLYRDRESHRQDQEETIGP